MYQTMDAISSPAAAQRTRQYIFASTAAAAATERDRAAMTRAARDRRLAAVLSDGSLVWLLDERFDDAHDTWTVDLLRADAVYGWRRQRYKYDAAADVLYFWGERPVPGEEVRALNLRALPRFRAIASPARVNHNAGSAPSLPAHGDDHRSTPGDEAIDEALEETFPASDPPFWMPGNLVGGSRLR
jgi:hypothetical protein